MSNMVASLRLKGKVDSSLTKALGKTDKDMSRSARLAKGRAGAMTRAAEDQARATGKAANETGRLARSMSNATTGSQRLGRNLKKNIKQMREAGMASKLLNRGLDGMANKWAGLGAGATLMLAGRQVGNIQERMTRLGIQAGKSDKEIQRLKDSIYAAALAPDVRVNPAQIMDAVDAIVEKTGDLDFAKQNLRNIGVGIQATGAMGKDVGEIMAEFQKMGITAPEKVMEALDILNKQGKMGAFTLQNIAALGPRVITAYTSAGRGGVQALQEMGAALQLIRMGTGSSEMAASAWEAVMRSLTDPTKIKQLEKLGLEIFDPEKLAEGKRVLRPVNELMAEIVQATGGDKVSLGNIFDAEAIRAFNQAAAEFQRTGQIGSLDKFMAVQGDGQTTLEDSARAAKTFNQALGMLYGSAERFADSRLTGVLQGIANLLDKLGSDGADNLMTVATYGAAAVASAVAVRKVARGVGAVRGFFSRHKKGGAGKSGGLLGEMTGGGPMAVEVVNWPGGGFGGGGSSFDSGGGSNRRAGKVGRAGRLMRRGGGLFKGAGRLAGKAFRPLGMLMGATNLVGAVRSGSKSGVGRTAGSMVGGMGGGALGAMLGSFVLPGIGTAVGGVLGSVIGDIIGEKTGEAAGQALESSPAETPAVVAAGEKSVVIHVHAAPGMDIEELARKVARKVRRPGTGDLYDG